MYDVSVQVIVKAIEKNKRIVIEWSVHETPTTVEWLFAPRANNSTFVSVKNTGSSILGENERETVG